jgi:hypothetical protein
MKGKPQAEMEKVNAMLSGNQGSGDHANASTQDAQRREGGIHPSTKHVKMGRSNYAPIDRTGEDI